MATYTPPSNIEDITIFNPAFFETADATLTQSEADKRYLRFPVAQGTETLQSINVNGLATFNNNIVVGSSTTTNNTPTLTTNKTALVLGTGGSGMVDVECPINIGGFGSLNLTTADINMTGDSYINQGTTNTTANNLGLTNFAGLVNANADLNVKNVVDIQDTTNPSTQHTSLTTIADTFTMNTFGTTPFVSFAINNANYLQYNSVVGGLILTGTDATINTTNPPTCNASSTIVLSDDSNKLPSTAWVRDYVASIPPPVATQYTYTETFTGSLSLFPIPIPTGCVKFDIKVIGTGGLAGSSSVQPPSGGETEYTNQQTGTGGGGGVAYKDGIPIVRQGINFTNTLNYINYGAGNPTEVKLNNESVCIVYSGGNGGVGVAGAGCTTPPVVNTNWGNWVYWNGNAGQAGPFITYTSPPDAGQVGGGNKYGGVCGNPIITNSTQGSRNVAGSGQLWGALTGPSYGFPSYSASPINYGGVILTWYIQS